MDFAAFWMSSAENDGLTTEEFVILVSAPKVSFSPVSVAASSAGSISVVRTSTPPPATPWIVASLWPCDEKKFLTRVSSGRVAKETSRSVPPLNSIPGRRPPIARKTTPGTMSSAENRKYHHLRSTKWKSTARAPAPGAERDGQAAAPRLVPQRRTASADGGPRTR